MKMSDNAFWFALWLTLALLLGIVACTAIVTSEYKEIRFAELGYTQRTLPGDSFARWVKP